jgi:hypothetical protein
MNKQSSNRASTDATDGPSCKQPEQTATALRRSLIDVNVNGAHVGNGVHDSCVVASGTLVILGPLYQTQIRFLLTGDKIVPFSTYW